MAYSGRKKCALGKNIMNRTERFYLIDKILVARKVLSRQEWIGELGIS
jgi:hypothetical protein